MPAVWPESRTNSRCNAPFDRVAWGLPQAHERLPNTISKAVAAARDDTLLHDKLGAEFVDYWAKSRHQEWLAFHTEGGNPEDSQISDWEYQRYFEMI
ncbi:MAG: hypothetical protein U5O39_13215 [Gammaproteobacteria bacterium]|nr:hypothetical protein [Gammaproteobacteria bacterium]